MHSSDDRQRASASYCGRSRGRGREGRGVHGGSRRMEGWGGRGWSGGRVGAGWVVGGGGWRVAAAVIRLSIRADVSKVSEARGSLQ